MMRNLAASLIEHEVIKTTVEKGKELRRFVEPLITRAKVDTLHNRRQIISQLDSRSATSKLFSNLGPRFNETNGGYLRVIKAGFREGDKADMCYVELTIRDLEQEAKVVGELAEENLVMPSDELPENKIEEKAKETAPAPAPEEVKAPKKAAKKTTTKKAESEESQTEVVTPKKPAKKTAEKKDTKIKTETKVATTKKPVKKKKAEKKEEKKSWWSRFFK